MKAVTMAKIIHPFLIQFSYQVDSRPDIDHEAMLFNKRKDPTFIDRD